MSGNANALNTQLLCQLECPVCLDTCTAPIYMCSNGHGVCAKCQPRMTECSVCRAPGKPTLRCTQLEHIAALVQLPCANQPQGCGLAFSMSEMAQHLPKCDHGFSCCVRNCKDWKGSAKDLRDHMTNVHPTFLIRMPASGVCQFTTGFKAGTYLKLAFYCYKGAYFSHGYEYNPTTQIMTTTLRILSHDAKEASLYYYSMEFASKSDISKLKVLYQGDVMTYNEEAKEESTSFMVPQSIISSYGEESVEFTRTMVMK